MTVGTAPERALSVQGAVIRHGAHVLADVPELRIEPGLPLTVVGESGSGKSVLAHAIMGTLPHELTSEGTLRLGSEVFDLADSVGRRHLWGHELALLPQEPALALDPTMRVRAQVAEGVRGWRPRHPDALHRADEALAGVGLETAGAAYPHTLSGGMAQRVSYVATTIGGARVLIVDEPSKGLDADSVERLADLLGAHVADGGILLTITHDLRLARRLGGNVLVMREASVVESGPVDQVLDAPSHAFTQRLVAAEPARWRYPWMGARTAYDPSAAPLVTADGIGKSYGARRLFEDLSLSIRPGERWSLTGPSGVGKTTLGNALAGLTAPDTGSVAHGDAARGGRIQKLYQDPVLSFPQLVPLKVAVGDVRRRHAVEDARLAELMEAVGLPLDLLRRRPGQVSGGELQRVAIVRAMLTRPALVFADEATSRLDLATQASTMDILMSEVVESDCALLLVTHDRDLAEAVTDHRVDLGTGAPVVTRRVEELISG